MKKQDLQSLFHEAIKNLEKFTLQNESSTVPHVLDLGLKNHTLVVKSSSFLKKVLAFGRSLLESLFFRQRKSKREQRRLDVQEELLRSVLTVKKHYQLLDKLKNGSEEQRRLALRSQQVIDRYNTLIKQSKRPATFKENVAAFFYDRLGVTINEELRNNTIDLPKAAFSQTAFDRSISNKINLLATNLQIQKDPVPLTQYETDAFCMKALTLIKNQPVPVVSIGEALNFVKSHPIETSVSKLSDKGSTSSIVSLSQVLHLFPGEIIELYGCFKRDSQSAVLSVPIADSFRINTKSIQKGFPHPSQYNGWALTDKLIPACPLRLDQLPLFQELDKQKKRLAEELLPKGRLIGKAKALLKLKKEAFDSNRRQFIQLHKKLLKAVVSAANRDWSTQFDHYFQLLEKQPSPFTALAKAASIINEMFIESPYQRLEDCWLEGADEKLASEDPKQRFTAAKEILEEQKSREILDLKTQIDGASTEFEKAALRYVLQLGLIVCEAAFEMILQQQSEKIEFAAPLMTDFSRRMQLFLFKQWHAFHQEFELPLESREQAASYLIELLETDIALFKSEEGANSAVVSLVNEIEEYYNSRFSTIF